MSNKDLVVDLDSKGDCPYFFGFDYKGGTGIDITSWDFYAEFGALEKIILSKINNALTEVWKEEVPFTLDIPQLSGFDEEPEWPLALEIDFGFNEKTEEMRYTHSLDKVVAIGFDMHRNHDGTYGAEFIARASKFRDALRELADKMDVELQKVETE